MHLRFLKKVKEFLRFWNVWIIIPRIQTFNSLSLYSLKFGKKPIKEQTVLKTQLQNAHLSLFIKFCESKILSI